jgi:hypothetical protein
MPFVSNTQRKRMFENKPEMAKERASKTPKGKKLPEHIKKKWRKHNTRLIVWTITLILIVVIRGAMLFSKEMDWTEATAYSSILLVITGIYELVLILKKRSSIYKIAFGMWLGGMFILGWANGAVGIIWNEDNPANLMYRAVFAVGLIGSLIAGLQPRRISYTMFAVAVVQLLVPLFALLVWPAQTSWGEAGVIGVFIINFIFAMIFTTSAVLFRSIRKY